MIHISPTRLLILPALALCCLCQCTQSGARHTTRATATKAAAPDASPARNRTWKPNKAVLPLRKQAVEILLAIKDHNRRSGGLAGAVKLAVELERFTEAWKVYDETREHSHMSFGRRWMELQHAEALTRRGRLTRALGILSRGSTPSDRTHQSAAWANLARAAEARGKHSLAARALKQTDPDVVPVVGLAARIHKAGERDAALKLLDWKAAEAATNHQVWPGVQELMVLARAFHELKERKRVEAALDRASKMAGPYMMELYSLSLINFELGHTPRGAAEFARALKLQRSARGGDATMQNALIRELERTALRYLALGRIDEASRLLQTPPLKLSARIAVILFVAHEASAKKAAAGKARAKLKRLMRRGKRSLAGHELGVIAIMTFLAVNKDGRAGARACASRVGLPRKLWSTFDAVYCRVKVAPRLPTAQRRAVLAEAEKLAPGRSPKDNPRARAVMLQYVAEAHLEAGDYQQARRVALAAKDSYALDRVEEKIQRRQVRAARSPEAALLTELQSIKKAAAGRRVDRLRALIKKLPASLSPKLLDAFYQAQASARFSYPGDRVGVQGALVRRYLRAGKLDRALKLARELAGAVAPDFPGRSLALVLAASVEARGLKPVLAEARAIKDPATRALALYGLYLKLGVRPELSP